MVRSPIQARLRANLGRWLEEWLGAQHELYRRAGAAWIRHLDTGFTIMGWDPAAHSARLAFPRQKATVDYLGVVKGGRAVAAEAKTVARGVWWPSAIPEHQAEALDELSDLGALAAILLGWTRTGEVWAIPWAAVKARMAAPRGGRAWRAGEPDGGAVIVGKGLGPADWLGALGWLPAPRAADAGRASLTGRG
ncbi:MAG: Holliday junction resolvase RecU [Bacillota bacterium]|nr:Holliday junction resolvase RecU [Bacillota bacterium]